MNITLINLHQLKTGGKALEGILYRNYKKKLFYLTKSQKNAKKINISNMYNLLDSKFYKKKIIKKDAITGHMLFGIHKKMLNLNFKYYTVLRDPYQRAKSYFFYMLNNNDFQITKIFIKKKINFEKFCSFTNFTKSRLKRYGFSNRDIEEIDLVVNNGQTRVISGNLSLSSKKSYILAKKNIKKYFISVGILEMFAKSILILAIKMNFKYPIFINKVNSVNSSNIKIFNEKKIRYKFNSYNKYDLRLHKKYSLIIDKEINAKLLFFNANLLIIQINSSLQSKFRPIIKWMLRR